MVGAKDTPETKAIAGEMRAFRALRDSWWLAEDASDNECRGRPVTVARPVRSRSKRLLMYTSSFGATFSLRTGLSTNRRSER